MLSFYVAETIFECGMDHLMGYVPIGRPDASKFEKIVAKRFRIFRPSLICSLNNCIIIAHFVTRRALKNVTKYSPMMLMMLIAMVWVFIDYVQ